MSGAEITCVGALPGCLPTLGRCPVSSDGQFVEQKVRRGLRRCREKIALRLLLAEATTSSGYNPGWQGWVRQQIAQNRPLQVEG